MLKGLSLTIERGEFFCLLGPSGCGKTTVLNLLAGFEQPTAGAVRVDGRPVKAPGVERTVVFHGDDSLYTWLTAVENVESPGRGVDAGPAAPPPSATSTSSACAGRGTVRPALEA